MLTLEECLETLVEKWPTPHRRNSLIEARRLFLEKVQEEDWGQLSKAFEYELADGSLGAKSFWSWLVEQLRTVRQKNKVKSQKAFEGLYEPSETDRQSIVDFLQVWTVWPQNTQWPEDKDTAWGSWKGAVRRVGVKIVIKTCEFYISSFGNPALGIVHPYHLTNFLTDGSKFKEWVDRASSAPSTEELDAFEAVWAWYPEFERKSFAKDDSLSFWVRHIRPVDRWSFLSAVKKYREEKRDDLSVDSKKFTRSVISFVGTWREVRYFRTMAADISVAVVSSIKLRGLINGQDVARVCNNMHDFVTACLVKFDSDVEKSVKYALDYIVEKNTELGQPVEDVQSIITEIVKSAWISTCRPPISVIE